MEIVRSLKQRLLGSFEKPEVYLGDLAVVPKSQFTSIMEFRWDDIDSDEMLRDWIEELVELPFLDDTRELADSAIRLDILVSNYTYGSTAVLFSNPPLPILWRPKIRVHFRLVRVRDSKVLGTYETKKTVKLKVFLSKVFTLSNVFTFRPAFSNGDLQLLLADALLDGLAWAKGKV